MASSSLKLGFLAGVDIKLSNTTMLLLCVAWQECCAQKHLVCRFIWCFWLDPVSWQAMLCPTLTMVRKGQLHIPASLFCTGGVLPVGPHLFSAW